MAESKYERLHKLYGYLNRCLEHNGFPPLFSVAVNPTDHMYSMMLAMWLNWDWNKTGPEMNDMREAVREVFNIQWDAA